jgi:LPS-assembly lipoprotein
MRKLILIGLILLSGCGFQLRGTIDIPPEWLAMHMQSPSPNGELASGVRSALSNNGVEWQEATDANITLQLSDEKFEQRNLTIGANARATQFELKLSASMRVLDDQGKELAPNTDVTVTKIMTHDPENVTGKVEESNLLRREMRTELIQQVMRRIRFLATA